MMGANQERLFLTKAQRMWLYRNGKGAMTGVPRRQNPSYNFLPTFFRQNFLGS